MFNPTAEALVSGRPHVSAHATGWWRPSDAIPSQWGNGHNFFSLQNSVYWLHFMIFHWLIFSGPESRILLLKQGLLSGSRLAPMATKLLCCCFALASSSQQKQNHAQQFPPLTEGAVLPTVARVQEGLDGGPSSHAVGKSCFFTGRKKQHLVVCQATYGSVAEALQLGNTLTAGLENAFWLSRSHCPSQHQWETLVVGAAERSCL